MFDNPVVALIAATVSTPAFVGIIEMLKRQLVKLFPRVNAKTFGYVSASLVSLGATALYLLMTNTFTVTLFAIYSVLVFVETNGLYKSRPKAA